MSECLRKDLKGMSRLVKNDLCFYLLVGPNETMRPEVSEKKWAPRPLNNILPPSTHGFKRSLQPYARNKWPTTWLESVRGHGPCQTRGVPQTPRGLHKPRLWRHTPTHPARTWMSGDTSTCRNASCRTAMQDAAQRQNHTPPTATRVRSRNYGSVIFGNYGS